MLSHLMLFFVLADVIANYLMLFYGRSYCHIFGRCLCHYMWWMFLPHWSFFLYNNFLLILFVLADVIANVCVADLIAIYFVASVIPLVLNMLLALIVK